MVTAELAAALPVLVLFMLTGVAAVQVADARARCLDAAREVARAAGRDDPRAVAIGQQMLGGPAAISVQVSSDTVVAVVTLKVHPLGLRLGDVEVNERVTAAHEQPSTASRSP